MQMFKLYVLILIIKLIDTQKTADEDKPRRRRKKVNETDEYDVEIEEEDRYISDSFYDSSTPCPIELIPKIIIIKTAKLEPELKEDMDKFRINYGVMRIIKKKFEEDLTKGMSDDPLREAATLKSAVTYIQHLPRRNETGSFLAIDFYEDKIRLLRLTIFDTGETKTTTKWFVVPPEMKEQNGYGFLLFVVECIISFTREHKMRCPLNMFYPLGIMIHFPLKRKDYNVVYLDRWAEGYSYDDIYNKDLGKILDYIMDDKLYIVVLVKAIIDHGTGTLMTAAWKDPRCKIGLFMSDELLQLTYLEDQKNIKYTKLENRGDGKMIVNVDWGTFGDDGSMDFIRTAYDRDIELSSLDWGHNIYKKMISYKYVSEIIRIILAKYITKGILFDGKGSKILMEPNRLTWSHIASLYPGKPVSTDKCQKTLGTLGIFNITAYDCINVDYICERVINRTAYLMGMGFAILIDRIEGTNIKIGVESRIFREYPHFSKLVSGVISDLISPNKSFGFLSAEDGRGRGAALAAAVTYDYYEEYGYRYYSCD